MGGTASCQCGGREAYSTDIQPLLEEVSKKSEWGQVIAANMQTACQIFHHKFEAYYTSSPTTTSAALTSAAEAVLLVADQEGKEADVKLRQAYAAIWSRYDENHSNTITEQQCQRMTLDLLLEQRKFLPRILAALVRELLRYAKQALEHVKQQASVGDDFTQSLYEQIATAANHAIEHMEFEMDEMVENHTFIASRVWSDLVRGSKSPDRVSRQDFLARYQEIPQGLLDPVQIVTKLGLVLEPQPVVFDESKALFNHVLSEISSKGLWAQLLCTHLQRVYKMFYRQFFIGMHDTSYEVDPRAISKRMQADATENEAKLREVYESLFFEYDTNHDGRLDRAEFRILVNDMLVEQKAHLPKLTEALIVDMLEMAKVDAKRGVADFPLQVPDGWANWFVEVLADNAMRALEDMSRGIDDLLTNSNTIADSSLAKLAETTPGVCSKREFVDNFGAVAAPIRFLDAQRFCEYLQGFGR